MTDEAKKEEAYDDPESRMTLYATGGVPTAIVPKKLIHRG